MKYACTTVFHIPSDWSESIGLPSPDVDLWVYSPNKNKKRPAPHVEVTEQNKSVSRSFQKLLNVKSFHAYCNGYS